MYLLYFFPLLFLIIFAIALLVKQNIDEAEKKREQYDYEQKLLVSDMNTIDTYNGTDFEYFCKVLFEKLDYEVSLTKKSGDYGVDLILSKNNIISVGQCKRYSEKVSISAVQEITAGKTYYSASNAFIITNNYFTKPAINLATANNIDLIDRKKLAELICKVKNEQEFIFQPIIKQVKKEMATTHDDFVKNNEYSTKFANMAHKIKDTIIIEYQKNNYLAIKNLIKAVENNAGDLYDNKITLHFFYQDIANIVYAMRDVYPEAINDCLFLCDKDINLLKEIDLKNATVNTISRKTIILEKQNKIEEAIKLCDFAIEKSFLDNGRPFSIRKIKLENRLKKQEK